jgi:hypothetical protein
MFQISKAPISSWQLGLFRFILFHCRRVARCGLIFDNEDDICPDTWTGEVNPFFPTKQHELKVANRPICISGHTVGCGIAICEKKRRRVHEPEVCAHVSCSRHGYDH